MKPPSVNISKSLARQTVPRAEDPNVTAQRRGGPTMTVPGEGVVQDAPHNMALQGGRGERSAAKYVAPMRRWGGG